MDVPAADGASEAEDATGSGAALCGDDDAKGGAEAAGIVSSDALLVKGPEVDAISGTVSTRAPLAYSSEPDCPAAGTVSTRAPLVYGSEPGCPGAGTVKARAPFRYR